MRDEIGRVLSEVEQVIVGKETVIEHAMMAILAEGHILMDDVPGVGKTTLALAFSRALDIAYNRIQFTPDVMPSDIVGFTMADGDGKFVYHPGIVTRTNLLLGDEINRTSSKTQSALLETMEEYQVTVDGERIPLQRPFIVIATQNRIGAMGTQPLPFAQMDRFLVRLSLGYPEYEAQMNLLRDRQADNPLDRVNKVLSRDMLLKMQSEVRQVEAKDAVLDYIARLAISSRQHAMLDAGISPRGTLFLDRMAKARAYMDGRNYVTGRDVAACVQPVCQHRILLNQKARLGGATAESVLEDLLQQVKVPDQLA